MTTPASPDPTSATGNLAQSAPGEASAPPKLLLLTTSYPLAGASVSGIFVKRLACALCRSAEVMVLTPASATPVQAQAGEPTIRTFRYAPRAWQRLAHGPGGIPAALSAGWGRRLLVAPLLIAMFWSTWREARTHDAILANWSVCGLAAGLSARMRGIPAVAVMRGEDVNRAAHSRLFRAIARVCLRLCARTVTVSEAMAQELVRMAPGLASRVVVIPNGVSADFAAVPDSRRDGRRLSLLCVGSLIPRKSVHTLIAAMEMLPAHVELTIVGDGPLAEALAAQRDSAGLGTRVRFMPFQAPEVIPALLAQADALVLSSLAEGRPNVVLEAFAAGRPVVASDIPGVRELVGTDQRGLLFPPGESTALAACLARLEDDELRRRLAHNGREFIRTQGLDWDTAASRYLRLFDLPAQPR